MLLGCCYLIWSKCNTVPGRLLRSWCTIGCIFRRDAGAFSDSHLKFHSKASHSFDWRWIWSQVVLAGSFCFSILDRIAGSSVLASGNLPIGGQSLNSFLALQQRLGVGNWYLVFLKLVRHWGPSFHVHPYAEAFSSPISRLDGTWTYKYGLYYEVHCCSIKSSWENEKKLI